MGTGCCVVHVGTAVEVAREVEEGRKRKGSKGDGNWEGKVGGSGEEDAYGEKAFEELVMRFEEPNMMARWDRPLFTVLWGDVAPPYDEIWREVVKGVGRDGVRRVVKANQATVMVCICDFSSFPNIRQKKRACNSWRSQKWLTCGTDKNRPPPPPQTTSTNSTKAHSPSSPASKNTSAPIPEKGAARSLSHSPPPPHPPRIKPLSLN